jgi:hypothetical protein
MNASDLIEHYELIRDLRADGFGRVRIAAALRERGIHVAPHVIQTVIYQMEREDRIPVKVERGPLDAAAEDEPIEDWLSRRAAEPGAMPIRAPRPLRGGGRPGGYFRTRASSSLRSWAATMTRGPTGRGSIP